MSQSQIRVFFCQPAYQIGKVLKIKILIKKNGRQMVGNGRQRLANGQNGRQNLPTSAYQNGKANALHTLLTLQSRQNGKVGKLFGLQLLVPQTDTL